MSGHKTKNVGKGIRNLKLNTPQGIQEMISVNDTAAVVQAKCSLDHSNQLMSSRGTEMKDGGGVHLTSARQWGIHLQGERKIMLKLRHKRTGSFQVKIEGS